MNTDNPFVGPRSLRVGEGIFGRDRERADLLDLVIAQRVVMFYSPSGAGKSSLIDAGLRPDLEAEGFVVSPAIRVGRHDTQTDNRYVAGVISQLEEELDPRQRLLPPETQSMTLVEYVDHRRRFDANSPQIEERTEPASDYCLIFDQFEELFTLDEVDQEAKREFITQLGALLRDRTIWAVISMREDFVTRLDPYLAEFPRQLSRRYRLDFLDTDAAELAITIPAATQGVTFTEDALRLLIDDLRTVRVKRGRDVVTEAGPHVQPVHLQVACREMWSRLPPGTREITVDLIRRHARTDEALRHFFDVNLAEVATLMHVDEVDIRSWIHSSLISKQGFRTQADADSFKVATDAEAVLQALEAHYLLRSDSVRGVRMYELTHDRMVTPIKLSNEVFAGATIGQRPVVERSEPNAEPTWTRSPGDGSIAVALGGGGNRAAVFGLGALLALVDSGLNGSTVSMSSVAGGSLANGITMTGPDFRRSTAAEFETHISKALRSIANRGVLFGGAPATRSYVLALVASLVLAAFALPFTLAAAFVSSSVVIVGAVVGILAALLFGTQLSRLSVRMDHAIDHELLGGSSITLSELQERDPSVHHVIGTTELQTSEPCYLSNRLAYCYRFGGSSGAPDLRVSTAVQASNVTPGLLSARSLPIRDLGLGAPTTSFEPTAGTETAVLSNGTLCDTFGTTWETGFDGRARIFPFGAVAQPESASFLLVVNGSHGSTGVRPMTRSRVFRWLQDFVRAQGVALDHAVALQRRALHLQFRDTRSTRSGALIQISDSPYRLPTNFGPGIGSADDAVSTAEEALDFLDRSGKLRDSWESIVSLNTNTATTFGPLGVDRSAALLEHGYILAMVTLFVVDGRCALLPVDPSRFRRLCE